jgi:hypothetical protein
MATKKFFFSLGTFSIKDGSEIRFWEDRWLGATSLREQYPTLYTIVRYKGDTIPKVLETSLRMYCSEEICLVKDLYLETSYFYIWRISIYNLDMTNFVGIFTRTANSL